MSDEGVKEGRKGNQSRERAKKCTALAREHSPLFFLLQIGKKLGPMLVSDCLILLSQAQDSIKEELKGLSPSSSSK